MFDYNLLGKGYRYSDFRNVCWSMSETAGMAFVDKYKQLYVNKYGTYRTLEEALEKRIDDVMDDVMDDLHGLILAVERKNNSKLAEHGKKEAANRTLLKNAKALLE